MKKNFAIILCLIVCICLPCVFLVGCNKETDSVVRIHIRANSNEVCDQEVKLDVRDKVVSFVTPLIAECKNSNEVKNVLSSNLGLIEDVADGVLREQGLNYKSEAKLTNEYFPSRDYDGNVFPSDYYDALILNLGTGTGNNWWCVAYPPLCFVGEDLGTGGIKYKSKLLELIDKFFK